MTLPQPPFEIITATYTPFDESGRLDTAIIPAYAAHLKRNRVAGVFINGTTGESLSLTVDERCALTDCWAAEETAAFKVIAHVGDNCLDTARRLASRAQQQGCRGIAAMAPSFFRTSTIDQLIGFLAPIAAAAPQTDFYYYHIPSRTGVDLSMLEFLAEASRRLPTFAGVKYTHDDLVEFEQCQAEWGDRYRLYFGRDELLLPALSLGAVGAVGTSYNFISQTIARLADHWAAQQTDAARRLFHSTNRFIALLQTHGVLEGGKGLMAELGLDCGAVRLPLQPADEASVAALLDGASALPLLDALTKPTAIPKMHARPANGQPTKR